MKTSFIEKRCYYSCYFYYCYYFHTNCIFFMNVNTLIIAKLNLYDTLKTSK